MGHQIPIIAAFGMAVRETRSALGMSQDELAEACGLSRVYLSDVELGKRNVSLENIARIANSLDLDVSVLFQIAEAEIDEEV